ncbi:hypothetical protein AB0436_23230 [Streptomyces sp. NPDC051322]|uniref:hypothetical protein n=1 Tax=Streptomyces sp. NPDC051322 TaxID=3154645 RepID=UPI00344BE496
MNKFMKVVSVGATVITLALAGATNSQAASGDGTAYASGSAGKAHFQAYGEIFTVYDLKKDGHSAIGILSFGSASSNYYYWDRNGSGTSVKHDLSIAEGTPLHIWSCLGDWDGTVTGGLHWETGCSPSTWPGTSVWA